MPYFFRKEGCRKKKQEYKISSSLKNSIVEFTITGEVAADDHGTFVKTIYEMIDLNKPKKLLVDMRKLKANFGYTDAYFRVQEYPSHRREIIHAIVDVPERTDYRSFHETVARNSGLCLKWFTDIAPAREWLMENSVLSLEKKLRKLF